MKTTTQIPLDHQPLTLKQLKEMETLHQGRWEDLKYEEDRSHQILLSRMSQADGEPFDHRVTVRKYSPKTGLYEPFKTYQAK
jgi:hypothetical protein